MEASDYWVASLGVARGENGVPTPRAALLRPWLGHFLFQLSAFSLVITIQPHFTLNLYVSWICPSEL